jgi:hypothetical protein
MKKIILLAILLVSCKSQSAMEPSVVEDLIPDEIVTEDIVLECEDNSVELDELTTELETLLSRVQSCESSILSLAGEDEEVVYRNPYYELAVPEGYMFFEDNRCEGYCTYSIRPGKWIESSGSYSSTGASLYLMNWFEENNSLAKYESWDALKNTFLNSDDPDLLTVEEWDVDGHEAIFLEWDGLANGSIELYIFDERVIYDRELSYYISAYAFNDSFSNEFFEYIRDNIVISDTEI